MVVGISNEECKFRAVLLEQGKARAIGRIRNGAAVNDVSHNGTVHKSVEPIATRKVKAEIIQGIDLAGNEQEMVKERLCQLQRSNASTSFPRFGERHVEVAEGEHALYLVCRLLLEKKKYNTQSTVGGLCSHWTSRQPTTRL